LIALLADGHLLVEGPPGLAKDAAIKALAHALEADFQRVQFTPISFRGPHGVRNLPSRRRNIPLPARPAVPQSHSGGRNQSRAAKVQSALLEAMAERQISVGAATYNLPQLFLVMATQNPIEQEGTYPLPEAQLDRFMLCIPRLTIPTARPR